MFSCLFRPKPFRSDCLSEPIRMMGALGDRIELSYSVFRPDLRAPSPQRMFTLWPLTMVTHTPTQCDTRLTVGVAPIHEAHCTSCSRYRTRPISRLRERTVTKPFTLAFARQSGPTVVHCLRIVSHELLSRRSDPRLRPPKRDLASSPREFRIVRNENDTQCQTSYPDSLVSPLPRRTICPDITITRGTEFRTCSDRYRSRQAQRTT